MTSADAGDQGEEFAPRPGLLLGGAYEVVTDLMVAAVGHDATAATALVGELAARTARMSPPVRQEVQAARVAVEQRDWPAVWARARQVSILFPQGFPPDVTYCPPLPGQEPLVPSTCGHDRPLGARFCPACGQPAWVAPGTAGVLAEPAADVPTDRASVPG